MRVPWFRYYVLDYMIVDLYFILIEYVKNSVLILESVWKSIASILYTYIHRAQLCVYCYNQFKDTNEGEVEKNV